MDLVGVGGSDRLQGGSGAEALEGQTEDKMMKTWTEDQISVLLFHWFPVPPPHLVLNPDPVQCLQS